MSKERIDYIKETYEMSKYDVNFFLGMGDIDWLIEQAERVQELEEREKRLRRHIFEARNDVVRQNKRYREAIQKAIAEFNQDEHQHGMAELIKVLEGDLE